MSDAALRDAPLTDQPGPAAEPPSKSQQPPTAWVAAWLARESPDEALYIASSERRADEIGRSLRQFAPDLEVLVLPPWDCLPYDRASPSREIMGRRMAVLRRLSEAAQGRRVLIASVEALMQLSPPRNVIETGDFTVGRRQDLDVERLRSWAASSGYVVDDRVDEPGEIAFHGEVIDIYPAAAAEPVRISLVGARIEAIRTYDPLSQRTAEEMEELVVGPASELILAPEETRSPGAEHRAPAVYGRMISVLDLVAEASAASDPKAMRRAAAFEAQVREAFEVRSAYPDGERPLPPEALFLPARELESAVSRRPNLSPDPQGVEPTPNFALTRNPSAAFLQFAQAQIQAGRRILTCGLPHESQILNRAIRRRFGEEPRQVESLADMAASDGGAFLSGPFDLDAGFIDPTRGLAVVAASDVLGGRLARRNGGEAASLLAEPELRIGDVVIHEEHGLGVLQALERVDVAGQERDALRLEYHGGASLLAPVEDFGRIWRYGSDPESVTLDRLHTDAWRRRRVEISAEIDRTAAHLVEIARARQALEAPTLEPDRSEYARFVARFPYPETPDQAQAIEAVLTDLASGRPMNRLVCGDVGFGKTEIALRAAAAAALAGKQVALVAPTTVLARQHFETFRRRFAGSGVEVVQLSRLISGADAREVRARLADGSARIVVGTHAVASRHVSFADLGLVIIDEEQRFGARLKQQLRNLQPGVHVLTMSATPIPRTLQNALVGIEEVSVIATPPARRQPIRTFLSPYDPATVAAALRREKRRGGQSFVVVPRIEDIDPMIKRLAEVAPDLTTRVAHGELPPEEVDEAMVGFADGSGDILLATNIIESGLDVPRANTMLVWRADRFGLAQLHQLRGRVGRGRTRGIVYLFTDPDAELPETTRSRLSTLEAFDRLGAGLAISARDLDIRGGGDIAGEDQAGHMQLIGLGLYQQLLGRALRAARGEDPGPIWTPEVNLGVNGSIPPAYVADAGTRINLYSRLARLSDPEDLTAFAEEVEDRFGPPPPEVVVLLDHARLAAHAREVGIRRIDAGPKGLALTLDAEPQLHQAAGQIEDGVLKGDRLVLPASPTPETTPQLVEEVLAKLEGGSGKGGEGREAEPS